MEMKLNVRNIDLRDTQESLEDNIKMMRDFGRKSVRVYAGVLGLAYDSARSLVSQGKSFVDEAEERGEALESATQRRVEDVYSDARRQAQAATQRLDETRSELRSRVRRSERQAEAELESQIESILERMGIPNRERINRLSVEIENLSQKIDRLARLQDPTVAEPMPGYDQLTAKEIVERLDGMSNTQLAAVQSYETAHENRVTVLREVERRLQSEQA